MTNLRTLQAELHAEQAKAQRHRATAIIRRYARHRNGRLVKCTASAAEVERDDPRELTSIGKYIYDTETAARACANDLRTVCGFGRLYVYPCRRSKHGHVHLTRQPTPEAPGGA